MHTDRPRFPGRLGGAVATWLTLAVSPARASLLQGDALDTVADYASWVVLVIAPLVGIGVFWAVHILPEKIAEKRHHPQAKAIQALCLLSLVFGGLLWPLALLWAVSKPVLHMAAYGTDRHHEDDPEEPAPTTASQSTEEDLARLPAEAPAATAAAPPTWDEVQALRDRLAALEAAVSPAPWPPRAKTSTT
mgnify:CR=1 FL=1